MQNSESIKKLSQTDMPRKLLFIVNPNAGKKVSLLLIETIRKEFPQNIYYQIVIWKDKNHFNEILDILYTQNYTDAVAVGGDGTVNEVAKSLIGTNITLGIVPSGSGNGLARSLGISMKIDEAIKQIINGEKTQIDIGKVNGTPFFCTSGVGFDAHIGKLFATSEKRGLKTYAKIVISQLFNYKPEEYVLSFDRQIIELKAFLITVANAGQYGNDFYIAPEAKLNDGLFHVVILKPFNLFQLPGLIYKLISKKSHLSSRTETYTCNQLRIYRNKKNSIHFDGEPKFENEDLLFELIDEKLNVIIGTKYKRNG